MTLYFAIPPKEFPACGRLIGGERHREWPEAGKAARYPGGILSLPCRPLSIGKPTLVGSLVSGRSVACDRASGDSRDVIFDNLV